MSANFAFLDQHDPQLVRLAGLAERYFPSDPNACLVKLRMYRIIAAVQRGHQALDSIH